MLDGSGSVSVNRPGSGKPTGTITLTVNGVAQPPVTVSTAGKATLPLAGLSAGNSGLLR